MSTKFSLRKNKKRCGVGVLTDVLKSKNYIIENPVVFMYREDHLENQPVVIFGWSFS